MGELGVSFFGRDVLEAVFGHTAVCLALFRIISRSVFEAGVSVDEIVESDHACLSGVRYYLHFLFLAGLEAYGCGGGYIEMVAEGGFAVKFQIAVHLKEVIVASDLHRTVAGVAYFEFLCASAGIVFQVSLGKNYAAYRARSLRLESGRIWIKDVGDAG